MGEGPVFLTLLPESLYRSTVSDVLAAVRNHLWSTLSLEKSASPADYVKNSRSNYNHLIQAVCYSH